MDIPADIVDAMDVVVYQLGEIFARDGNGIAERKVKRTRPSATNDPFGRFSVFRSVIFPIFIRSYFIISEETF